MGFNFIESLINVVKEIWPFTRLSVWEKGIRETYWPAPDVVIFENGRFCWRVRRTPEVTVEDVGPGWWTRILFWQEVHSLSVVQCILEMRTSHITTVDDWSVSYSPCLIYTVKNVRRALTEVHDLEQSLKGLCEMWISSHLRTKSWQEIRDGQETLEKELKKTLHTETKDWGVAIHEVMLTSLVRSKQTHRFMTMSQESAY